MDATSPPAPASAATCLPHANASPADISCALVFLQEELVSHYLADTLSWLTWAKALNRLRPDLWITKERFVSLHAQDMRRLTQHLTRTPELLTRKPHEHGPFVAYLAKRQVNYADEALDELEAAPKAYGLRVWNLVLGLALGNSTADKVYQDTCLDEDKAAKPAGANVHARGLALRQVRGEYDFPTRPPHTTKRARSRT
ncbi:MAG: hypothetical protein EOO60_00235 [Hymenobacter sp.]|nr:MAG: hypothetical protein EOO60_00235 [Hymenobacter sp.]